MGLERPIKEAAESASDAAENAGRVLIPWLPEPKACDHCGAYCLAENEFVAEQAMHVDVWVCPECSSRYYRDE